MPIPEETQEPAPKARKVKPVTAYRVRRVTPEGNDPVIFKHDDKGVARQYVKTNHPRGLEVYVEHPDGYREHYSADQEYGGHENGGWNELQDEDLEGRE